MNFDRFNPLSNYLYHPNNNSPLRSTTRQGSEVPIQLIHTEVVDDDHDVGGEMSDWGIEESTQTKVNNNNNNSNSNNNLSGGNGLLSSPSIKSNSTTTTSNQTNYNKNAIHNQLIDDFFPLPPAPPQPSYIHQQHQQHQQHHQQPQQQQQNHYINHPLRKLSTTLLQPITPKETIEFDFKYYYDSLINNQISFNTENFSKFIKRYLSLENKLNEFWEKFQYNLVLSNNLLKDSMILSIKNDINNGKDSKDNNNNSKDNNSNNNLSENNDHSINNNKFKNDDDNYDDNYDYDYDSFIYSINNDGTILKILNRQYELNYNYNYNNMKIIILIILMIIYLLKQQQLLKYNSNNNSNGYGYGYSHGYGHGHGLSMKIQFKLFKIIIYISMKLIKVKKFKLIIESNQILLNLQKFLIMNYKINQKLINLKEYGEQFQGNNNIDHIDHVDHNEEFEKLKQYLYHILLLLNLNLQNSIIKLLPFMNGELLEQYCLMNNIKLDILNQENESFTTSHNGYGKNLDFKSKSKSLSSSSLSLENINYYFNKFDNLRKLFICQLLIINHHQPCKFNFFLYKLMDQFNINDKNFNLINFNSSKLKIIHNLLIDHNLILSNINGLFEKFEFVNQLKLNNKNKNKNKNKTTTTTTTTVVTDTTTNVLNNSFMSKPTSSLLLPPPPLLLLLLLLLIHLDDLINKLSNLTINLKYFQKYNNSIKNFHNIDEHQDKLLIFNQFKQDLNNIKSLYKLCLNDLYQESSNNSQQYSIPPQLQVQPQSPTTTSTTTTSTTTISSPTNSNGNRFSLKEFSIIKKRSSITTPTTNTNTNTSTSNGSGNGNGNGNINHINSKRFSGAFTVIQPNRFSLITNISEIEDFNI